MIVDSTNPRIMADNIRELARNGGGGGSDLPDVTIADNGKVLGVVAGSWNKMDVPSGEVDYSTSEQDTGRKWIDGKPIYQKTVVKSDNITSGVDNAVLHGIDNIDEVIDYDGIMIESSGYSTKMTQPVASASSSTSNVNATYAGYVNFVGKTDFLYTLGTVIVNQVSKIVVTIYYTKTEVTRKRKTTKGEN